VVHKTWQQYNFSKGGAATKTPKVPQSLGETKTAETITSARPLKPYDK
jgi:hypothetical protein